MRLAIMQPYLWSAWGYYRLFAAADMFIIHDDVQYVKESWINRNKFTLANGEKDWFTLPLKKMPTATMIKDIQLAEGAQESIKKQMRRFPVFKKLGILYPWEIKMNEDIEFKESAFERTLKNCVSSFTPAPPEPKMLNRVIQNSMLWALNELDMWDKVRMNNTEEIGTGKLKGEDRVIEICKYFRATEYINLSGGRKLYDKKKFADWGIDLQFLPELQDKTNVLERIAQVGAKKVKEDIYENLK